MREDQYPVMWLQFSTSSSVWPSSPASRMFVQKGQSFCKKYLRRGANHFQALFCVYATVRKEAPDLVIFPGGNVRGVLF